MLAKHHGHKHRYVSHAYISAHDFLKNDRNLSFVCICTNMLKELKGMKIIPMKVIPMKDLDSLVISEKYIIINFKNIGNTKLSKQKE